MIQMASALAVATVFIGLWTPISTVCSRRRGAYTRGGGVIAEFYGIWSD
jgi:predicted kinase